ncbi:MULTISPECIES: RAxF-45 family protein [Sporosarcina]|nr:MULTISPECIES: RAxF-45 family protein [Sporosarcina]WJY28103.1 RAxF-45 family protein [Sporosarcina sp. 0.2-SM1T-5]
MEQTAALTGVQVDTSMYFARVITFDFLADGIRLSIFRKPKNRSAAD